MCSSIGRRCGVRRQGPGDGAERVNTVFGIRCQIITCNGCGVTRSINGTVVTIGMTTFNNGVRYSIRYTGDRVAERF